MAHFNKLSLYLATTLPPVEDQPVDDQRQKKICLAWLKHAGKAALFSRPLLFESGRLLVFCHVAVWANEIRHRSPSLTKLLQSESLQVSRIIVRTCFTKPSTHRQTRPPMQISKQSSNTILQASHRINNPVIKAAMLRLSKRLNAPLSDQDKN